MTVDASSIVWFANIGPSRNLKLPVGQSGIEQTWFASVPVVVYQTLLTSALPSIGARWLSPIFDGKSNRTLLTVATTVGVLAFLSADGTGDAHSWSGPLSLTNDSVPVLSTDVGDIDLDSKPDLLAADSNGVGWLSDVLTLIASLVSNSGSIHEPPPLTRVASTTGTSYVTLVDVDGDADLDFGTLPW